MKAISNLVLAYGKDQCASVFMWTSAYQRFYMKEMGVPAFSYEFGGLSSIFMQRRSMCQH